MTAITASIVVSFGGADDSEGLLLAELDSELNNDKSSFLPSETAFFLVYKSANVTFDFPKASSGGIIGGNVVTRTIEEQLRFTRPEDAVSLAKVPSGSVTVVRWYGNSGDLTFNGRIASLASGYPAVVDVQYVSEAYSYELIPPSIDTDVTPEWPILVFIEGEVA